MNQGEKKQFFAKGAKSLLEREKERERKKRERKSERRERERRECVLPIGSCHCVRVCVQAAIWCLSVRHGTLSIATVA